MLWEVILSGRGGYGGYLRAVHTGDMPFIFRNLEKDDLKMWPGVDGADRNDLRRVTGEFGSLYGRFVREGNPGGLWPLYTDETQAILWFGEVVEAKEHLLIAEKRIFEVSGFDSVDALEQRLAANLDQAFAAETKWVFERSRNFGSRWTCHWQLFDW